jgi:hypothetical protein
LRLRGILCSNAVHGGARFLFRGILWCMMALGAVHALRAADGLEAEKKMPQPGERVNG